jgi:PAS domain S-box-containing protein
MRDEQESKTRLLRELEELRRRNSELEYAETDRRAALDALRDSEMKFRSVAESTIDAIVSIDTEDRIIYWNPGAEKIFGYSEDEVLGQPVTILIPERLREAHRQGLERFRLTGKRVLIGKVAEVQALRKDATEFDAELSLSTWTSREGRFFSGIIRDISDRKEAERALEQSTREARQRTAELESLIQMVAHDLKSPVIAMVGFVRALKARLGKGAPDSKTEQILQQLTNAGTSMERFLGDLLDGLVCDQSAPQRSPVSLDEIIRSLVNEQSRLLAEKRITISMDLPSEVPLVYADERRVRQVLDNILGNAIRHMGEKPGPVIRISVEELGRFVIARISDNGIGIPAEYLPRIFDRFFRVPKAECSRGTGLGLAIARKIIESHEGTIGVESEEGQGTTFSFSLPKCSPPECVDEDAVKI